MGLRTPPPLENFEVWFRELRGADFPKQLSDVSGTPRSGFPPVGNLTDNWKN
jgi:hypothetical protein